jgi:hypothetical protein
MWRADGSTIDLPAFQISGLSGQIWAERVQDGSRDEKRRRTDDEAKKFRSPAGAEDLSKAGFKHSGFGLEVGILASGVLGMGKSIVASASVVL